MLGAVLWASLAHADDSETLRWAADAQGGAPYVFQDPADPNRIIGFEVDFAEQLAKRLNLKARPVFGPWEKLLDLVTRQDADVAINGIEFAEEKRRIVGLSIPYFAAEEVLTFKKGNASAPKTLAALQGKKVGTLPGSLAERIALRAGADVRTYEGGQDEIYDDLKLGRTDAVLLDETIAHYYADIDPVLETIHGDFGAVNYAVAVAQNDERLPAINAAIESMRTDGTLRAIYERWGLWTPSNAKLFNTDASVSGAATEFERWQTSVGTLPPFWERVRSRYPALLPLFLKGAGLTLLVSLCAMSLAVALGISLALLRRHGPKPIQWLAMVYIEAFRGTPLLIQLTMIYFGLPELGIKLDPFVSGVLALGLNYAAAEAENYRAGLESVPVGQLEASKVLGLSTLQTLRHVVGPQALRISIPPMTNDFIALLKDSSLVSLVTLTELTKTYTNLANSTRDHLGLGVLVAIAYLVLGLPFAQLARRMESYFGRHLKRGAR